jgi:hypothetical protein
MKKTYQLRPVKTGVSTTRPDKVYYEQIIMSENDYPLALLHIDNFWQGKGGANKIYDALDQGKTVTVNVTFEIAEA